MGKALPQSLLMAKRLRENGHGVRVRITLDVLATRLFAGAPYWASVGK
jgi:hypothetical protein